MEERDGRTLFGRPLTCLLRKVLDLKSIPYNMPLDLVVVEDGEWRLSPGMHLSELEIGSSYFFQTVDLEYYKSRPIHIVDYIKL